MVKKITKKLIKITNASVKNANDVIVVKNVAGTPDTTAKILAQNRIDFVPKVSVVIPVYNVGDWLRECLDSVCGQTLKEIEIICIDDGSTDNSLEILKEYAQNDNRITVLMQENSGAGIARNAGLAVVKGRFVAFMDPDDFYPSENTLKKMYDTAVENNVKICGGTMQILKDKTISFIKDYLFDVYGIKEYTDYQFDCGYTRFIYDVDLVRKNNILFPDYLRGQDPVFFVQVMHAAGRFYVMEDPSYVYRVLHKTINWTQRRVDDYLCSLIHGLEFSVKHNYEKLTNIIIDRRIDKLPLLGIDENLLKSEYMKKLLGLREKIRDPYSGKDIEGEKKIFLISHSRVISTVGGATAVFWNMAKYLSNNGYNVTCLCYSDLETTSAQITDVHFVNLRNFYRTKNFSEAINAYVDYKKPDLMIFFFPDVFLNAALSEKNNEIPKILMFHSRPDWYFFSWSETQKKQIVSLYKNTFSQVLLPGYVNLLPDFIDKKMVRAIANPVQQVVKRNDFKERKKIIFLSRYDQCKGLEFLLLAYKIVAEKYPDWKLDIYGQFITKEYEEQISNMIKTLGLTNNVFLKGVTTDVLNTLCEYDFCVFPSYFEGFSVGLSEALSVGLPCIGLNGASGVNEQIIDGVNGFLTDDKYTDFAEKIEKLISDKRLRTRLAKNAIDSMKKYADAEIYSNWLKFINQILSNEKIENSDDRFDENVNTLFPIPSIKRAYINNADVVQEYADTGKLATGPHEIIVSLTSYPARIGTVNQTIESLLNQSLVPDKVVLWLAPEQFPNREKDLPQELLDLRYKGLVIDWYHNVSSYKKLIPALKKYPDALIVTADDDILYQVDWLKKLYDAYKINPGVVWCHRSHKIKKNPYEYLSWVHCISTNVPAYTNFCTTGGGVLYPPHSFYSDVLDENLFMSLCPTADDIWFWAMLVLNKKKVCTVPNNYTKINLIDGTQENALWLYNGAEGGNNKSLANLYKEYPMLLGAIQEELNEQKAERKKQKFSFKNYVCFPYYLCANWYIKNKKIPQVMLKKYGKLGGCMLKGEKISELPDIFADEIISLGLACRPAYQLKKNGLRRHSYPFDYMINDNLNLIVDTLKSKTLNWFYNFTLGTRPCGIYHIVTDNHTKMISMHHFPLKYSVKDYLPIFNDIFNRRKNRLCRALSIYNDVCFVMNRTCDVIEMLQFIKSVSDLYPDTSLTLINVRQDESCKDVYKYTVNDKCVCYDIHCNDVHDVDPDSKTNGNWWIGSDTLWRKLTAKLHLNHDAPNIDVYSELEIYTRSLDAKINLLQKQISNLATIIKSQTDKLSEHVQDANNNIVNEIGMVKGFADKLAKQYSEPYWANVYHDTINNTNWLNNKSVSPGRWAVSYVVLYVLYRILDEIKPQSILECGLGQSSKLTIQYADSHKADLTICENNSDWLSFFQRQFPTADIYTKILDTEMINVVPGYESRTYVGFDNVIKNKKFNLVLIDGPLGSQHYSRPEVLSVVNNLDKSFVILMDDMNRVGEQETFEALKNKLRENNIDFKEGFYESDKILGLICSPDLEWLTTL